MAKKIDDKFKKGYVKFKLFNVPVRFCHLLKPDTAFNKNAFCLEALPDDATAKGLEEMGFELKTKKDKEGNVTKNILKAKSNAVDKSGKPNSPPTMVGIDGRTPFTEEVGNGSICNLLLSARAWDINGGWTLSAYIDAVQVIKHVPKSNGFEDLSEDVPF